MPAAEKSLELPFATGAAPTNEQTYFDTLHRMARGYKSATQLCEYAKERGLTSEDMLAMGYECLRELAETAIKGKRRPK